MRTKKCPYCGKEIQETATICTFCQKNLPAASIEPREPTLATSTGHPPEAAPPVPGKGPPNASPPPPTRATQVGLIVLIVGIVVSLARGPSWALLLLGLLLLWAGMILILNKASRIVAVGGGFVVAFFACGLLAVIVGPIEPTGSPQPAITAARQPKAVLAPSSPTIPPYRVVSTKDVSMGRVRRLAVKVALPEHYGRENVEKVAQAVVADLKKREPLNAVSILFYGPGTSISGVFDVARVEWAPNGKWEDAGSVQAGDYSSFGYFVDYNYPARANSESQRAGSAVMSGLRRSTQTGLLGVPLPQGAKLVESTPGDPSAGRDPSERYEIAGSSSEIVAFYLKEMLVDGWTKNGVSSATTLVFDKSGMMIGILVKKEGGSFTLWGS
jgi:hypothetical protein